jgi:hypothetical protein
MGKSGKSIVGRGVFMFYVLALAGLYILGLWWCYEVIGRFREDVKEIREIKGVTRKAVIIFIWAITVIIAIALIKYSLVIIKNLFSLFHLFS